MCRRYVSLSGATYSRTAGTSGLIGMMRRRCGKLVGEYSVEVKGREEIGADSKGWKGYLNKECGNDTRKCGILFLGKCVTAIEAECKVTGQELNN